MQPLEGQQRLPVGIRQRQLPHIEGERERIEMDFSDTEDAPVVRAHEVLQKLARVVGHGEEPGRAIGAEQHQRNGECNDQPSIAAHGPMLHFLLGLS